MRNGAAARLNKFLAKTLKAVAENLSEHVLHVYDIYLKAGIYLAYKTVTRLAFINKHKTLSDTPLLYRYLYIVDTMESFFNLEKLL
jgi:hypothetical protein